MEFPKDFPMMPPELYFVSEFWHPNVYTDGKVCISILHPPGVDDLSDELPGERWMPSQSVSSILLSVISMLNDPNFSSPANVDASVECRKDFNTYTNRIKKLVEIAKKENGHIKIPHPESNPEEKKKYLEKQKLLNLDFNLDDYLEDDEGFNLDIASGDDEEIDFPFEDQDQAELSEEENQGSPKESEQPNKEKNKEESKSDDVIDTKEKKKEESKSDDNIDTEKEKDGNRKAKKRKLEEVENDQKSNKKQRTK